MNYIRITLTLFLACLFAMCSTEESADVNQDRIQMSLRLEYDGDRQQTEATATFRFGEGLGTLLELTDPAAIRFNEQEMFFEDDVLVSKYSLGFASKIPSGQFEYIDLDGKSFTNEVSIPSRILLDNEFASLSKSQSNVIPILGEPLEEKERFEIIIEYIGLEQSGVRFFEFRQGEDPILSIAELQDLPLGSATLSVYRSRNRDLEEGTSAGGSISEHYRISREVQVVE